MLASLLLFITQGCKFKKEEVEVAASKESGKSKKGCFAIDI
jgi:hypothetical protein